MFSGIIADVGEVLSIDKLTADWTIKIKTQLDINKILIGDSVSCDGICLTVIDLGINYFVVQVSNETTKVTNISCWHEGYRINLEKSLLVGDHLNGHFVLGHVDSCGKIENIKKERESHIFQILVPKKLNKFIANKGSIAINGVSLTVNEVFRDFISVNIIPYTWRNTNIQYVKINSKVNIEIDLIARYINGSMVN